MSNTKKWSNMALNVLGATAGGATATTLMAATTAAYCKRGDILRAAARVYIKTVYAGLVSAGMGRSMITYDPEILRMKRVILVSNHVSVFDWLVIWLSMEKLGFSNVIICTKRMAGPLAPLNVFMKWLGFPVIEQDLDTDYVTIARSLANLSSQKRYCFVIFPEGKLRNSIMKQSVGETTPVPEILPIKTRGFEIAVDALRKTVEGVVDCTLSYDDKERLVMPGPSRVVLQAAANPPLRDCEQPVVAEWLKRLFEDKVVMLREIKGTNHTEKYKPNFIKHPRNLAYNTMMVRLLVYLLKSKWLGAGVVITTMATALRRRHRA